MEQPYLASNARNANIALLYTSYQRPVLAYLTRLVHDAAAAEDLCQETFIKALRHWDQHDPAASASAWIYRIAANTAYDYLRRVRRISFTPLDYQQPSQDDDSLSVWLDTREPVQRALEQLPSSYSAALVLYERDGYTTEEIATTFHCSESAVRTRLSRARARFRKVYDG